MFERFTEQARRTLFFARFEVTQLGGTAIEPEHILLGLLRESKGLVMRIFQRTNISPATLREQIEARMEFRERIPTSVEIPFTPATMRALNYTAEEADRLKHSYIGTEHLLLGLLREEGALAAALLTAGGLRLEDARQAIFELLQVAQAEAEARGSAELERLADIRQSVEALARLAPDSGDVRRLVQQIEHQLDLLMRFVRDRP